MTTRVSLSNRLPWLLMLAVLLLASAVRFHRLGAQSLWYDEVLSAVRATRTLPELIPLLQRNVHVPAYFALLGWWEDVAGSSEFALRALSAFCSILSIAWCFALGKRLTHPVAGLAAAAFVAFNSFSIYYAQEARMYAMLTAIAAASMWIFVGFLHALTAERRSRQRLVSILVLGGINALGIYTHIFYALVMVAQGLLAALWFGSEMLEEWRSTRGIKQALRSLRIYLLVNLLTITLFAPWLNAVVTRVFAKANPGSLVPLEDILRQLQGNFAYGSAFEFGMGNLGFVTYFFLFFGLIGNDSRRRAWWTLLLPPLWALSAVALYLQLGLGTRYLRFLLPAQLGFALWMGRGVWILWTRQTRDRHPLLGLAPKLAAALASGTLLLSMFDGLHFLYHHNDFQRDDVRGLVARIEMELREGDAIVVSTAGFEEVLRYYYRSEAPVYGLPTSADDDITRAQTSEIIREHQRIHVIFYGAVQQDPRGIVEATLNREAYEVSDEWIDDLRYVQYISPAPLQLATQVDLRFGDEITLRSYALSAVEVKAGDVIQVQLLWTAKKTLTQRYKVFLQLLNADGVLAAQRDSEPGGGSLATNTWPPGDSIVDNHALMIPADLPAGDYVLIAGLYDINDASARLPVTGKTYFELSKIAVD